MWRRLNREDLTRSNPLLSDTDHQHWGFVWSVYEDYEIVHSDDGEADYVQAVNRNGKYFPEAVKVYKPLLDTPYLFLEFARIVEHKNPDQALDNWIHKYGLLG